MILTVSQIIQKIKSSLEGDFNNLVLEGEISNFSMASSGHYYFSLKDNNAMVSCALFKGMALRNPMIRQVKEGSKVQVYGDISVYAKRGSFQLIVKKIVPLGTGSLKEQFEKLKRKLTADGLFDLDKKKEIPAFPQKVGVVTALGAAALQDFLNIVSRRSHGFDLVISPSLVQGDAAPSAIINALEKLKSIKSLEIVVLTRGGGSLEDLWAFNDEKLIRYLSTYPIPIISAVGHQVDFTLVDFVSDKRVETPSAAAEFLSASQVNLSGKLSELRSQMDLKMSYHVQHFGRRLSVAKPNQQVSILQRKVFRAQQELSDLKDQISRQLPKKVEESYYLIDETVAVLKERATQTLRNEQKRVNGVEHFLKAINPSKVLLRGYSYTEYKGSVVTGKADFSKIKKDEALNIIFHDGIGEVSKC